MRVLFVCTGNTCRSPMAEALFREAAQRALLDMTARSAGVSAVDGAPASRGALRAMAARGVDLSGHRARMFTQDMADEALVLAMTARHEQAIRRIAPFARVHTLSRFVGLDEDICDPFGGNEAEYEACAAMIAERVQALVERLAAKAEG